MNSSKCYEAYPAWIVLLASLVSLAIYAIGAYILYQAGWIWMALYILYVVWLEIRLLRKSCVDCYYYGKVCAFGKGKVCKVFFKRGDTEKFAKSKITWASMIPDLLVSAVPVVVAIVLMIIGFSWTLLILALLLIILTSAGNGYIRGSLACLNCRQREIGCPAMELFSKKKPA